MKNKPKDECDLKHDVICFALKKNEVVVVRRKEVYKKKKVPELNSETWKNEDTG